MSGPTAPQGPGDAAGDLRKRASGLPDAPGVYLFKDPQGTILYVGKAVSLKKRVASYFTPNNQGAPKVRALVAQSSGLDFILTPDEDHALLLESNLIKKNRPRYNILLRDDKSYPYLKLTLSEDFPRVLISRRPSGDGSRYYGPYPNLKLREIVKTIYRFFNIRDCDIEIDGKLDRPCLSYQIKQCPAPCVGYVTSKDYRPLVRRVQWFLEGKHEELTAHVREGMLKASERQEYEEAAKFRDLLASIERMQEGYSVLGPGKRDLDVVALAQGLGKVLVSLLQVRQGKVVEHVRLVLENELEQPLEEVLPFFARQYYSPGTFLPEALVVPKDWDLPDSLGLSSVEGVFPLPLIKASGDRERDLMGIAEQNVLSALREDVQRTDLLKELQGLLGLGVLPRNIACFDISTLQGSFTVGSAVFFRDGVPDKGRYRKFKIKEVEGQDDYRSHQEMMRRYLRLLEREGLPAPDLFLIDGGKGQLGAVRQILDGKGDFGLAALAKREEEIFVPGREAPVDFRGHLKVRHLLQRVRDESHRFAVGYHRIIRDRQAVTSLLSQVKGIGPTRLRALLTRFGSAKGVQEAPLEELMSVPGLSKELAHQLYRAFHKDPA